MPIVTVSITTHNRKVYLKEAIESVLAQTYRDYNLLVSDNGSQDGTKEMMTDYCKKDRRIIYHRFPENVGPSKNWKYVLTEPKTELIAFLPDDDLWLPDHLKNAVQALQESPDVSLFCCKTEFFREGSGLTGATMSPWWLSHCKERTCFDARSNFTPWLVGTPMSVASVVIRRSALEKVLFFEDDRFSSGDWFIWGQIALYGSMIYDPIARVKYRWHSKNDSQSAMKGAKFKAKWRFAVRWLATRALEQRALNTEHLIEEVSKTWPKGPASLLIVALSSYDTHPELRKVALEIFKLNPEIGIHSRHSRHCRIAGLIGTWYLYIADVLDRIVGRWWKPSGMVKLQ